MTKPGGRFVWVRGMRGPVPEKWPHGMVIGGTKGKEVLDSHELGPDEFQLTIAILEQRYPPPKPPEEPEPSPPAPAPQPPTAPAAAAKAEAAA